MEREADNLELKRCANCGKLYRGAPGRQRCHTCVGDAPVFEAPVPEEEIDPLIPLNGRRLAALMAIYDAQSEGVHGGLIPPDHVSLMHPALGNEPALEAEGACVHCGKPRIRGSEYCLDCQTRLFQEFGHAARTVQERMEQPEPADKPNVRSLLSGMEQERTRVHHTRTNPYPLGRLRPE